MMVYAVTVEIPEKQQAEALAEVARIGAARAEALAHVAELTAELEPAAVHAARLGAPRGRIKELAQVSPATLYGWFEAAGLPTNRRKKE
jgi:hypothetical protein